MQQILEFFLHPLTENIIVPVIILALTIAAKAASKPSFSISKNDFLICFDLLVLAIFLFIVNMIAIASKLLDINQNISKLVNTETKLSTEQAINIKTLISTQQDILLTKISLSWLFLFMLFLITIVLIFTTQKWGWDSSGEADTTYGITIPNLIAFIFLVLTTSWITL